MLSFFIAYFLFWMFTYITILIILGVLFGNLRIGKSARDLSTHFEREYHRRREQEWKTIVGEYNGRAEV